MVVDASVLVELTIAGRHREGADALLDRYETDPMLDLRSGAHALVEAAHALRRLVRQRAIDDAEHARRALGWLAELDIVLEATAPWLDRIWQLRDRMSAYDAAYAAVAEAHGVPLVTTDGRLLAACVSAGIDAVHLDTLAGPDG